MRSDNAAALESSGQSADRARPNDGMIYASAMHRRVDLRRTRSFDYRPEVRDGSPGYRARNDICQNIE